MKCLAEHVGEWNIRLREVVRIFESPDSPGRLHITGVLQMKEGDGVRTIAELDDFWIDKSTLITLVKKLQKM